jgi:uncharacterized protein
MFGNMSTIPQSPNRAPAGRCSSVLAVGLLIGATLIGAGAANGQSFDCRKARSADELTICQESGLAKLDQELASLRRQRKEKHHKADRDEAGDNETAFMNARRRCGEHRACIEQSYRNRIQELTRSSPEEEREQASPASAKTKRTERRNGSREEGQAKAPANAAPLAEQRDIEPNGSSTAAGERQRSGDGIARNEAAASEPPKHHQKRSAQAGAQPAPTGTPTIQWVDPPPSH